MLYLKNMNCKQKNISICLTDSAQNLWLWFQCAHFKQNERCFKNFIDRYFRWTPIAKLVNNDAASVLIAVWSNGDNIIFPKFCQHKRMHINMKLWIWFPEITISAQLKNETKFGKLSFKFSQFLYPYWESCSY